MIDLTQHCKRDTLFVAVIAQTRSQLTCPHELSSAQLTAHVPSWINNIYITQILNPTLMWNSCCVYSARVCVSLLTAFLATLPRRVNVRPFHLRQSPCKSRDMTCCCCCAIHNPQPGTAHIVGTSFMYAFIFKRSLSLIIVFIPYAHNIFIYTLLTHPKRL